ncbi:hypothetical protein [Rugosimonospora africana]|uniref:hypothetical protein n=1 Tax=Rugosimonospora africana TaxID=556532 RepID=UPI001943EC5E|nr:hypothetical protein [Rugosimonospora africana]
MFFDAGSGGLLWMASLADRARWGQPVDLTRLPISADLRDELIRLVTWYDTSLNWDYPPDPGPWCESECERFNGSVRQALSRLREELGPGWSIADEFKECHEDPDRERYLADPRGFKR